MSIPIDSKARKALPVATGFVDYFPDAMAAVAALSQHANEKHNPGESLHWSKGKSNDHDDCLLRHFLERYGFDDDDGFLHLVKVAWRAMASLQTHIENGGEYRVVDRYLDRYDIDPTLCVTDKDYSPIQTCADNMEKAVLDYITGKPHYREGRMTGPTA